MAETTVSPNNKSVNFRRLPKGERPHAADGMAALATPFPKKIGVKRMPKKVRRATKQIRARGMISEKAMAKHLGGE